MGIYDRDYTRDARRAPSGIHRLSGWSFNTWLIVVNVAVFALGAFSASGVLPGFLARFIGEWGPFSTAKAFFMVVRLPDGTGQMVWGLEVWRFVTFQFLHANWIHLFFNMFALWLFGELVEQRLGTKRYAAFYLACGIFGALLYLFLNMLGNAVGLFPGFLPGDPRAPLIGASAGVFGVLMAAAYFEPNAQMQILFLPFTLRLRTLAYIYVALALWNLLRAGQNAGGDAAHIGGAIAGFILVRNPHHLADFFDVFGPPRPKAKPRRATAASAARPPRVESDGEVDRILAKVSTEGLHSLSAREREVLRQASEARREPMAALTFEVVARSPSCHARVGRVATRHGSFDTPGFMPVGTKATVKGILPHLVAQTGAQVVLANTLHLLLRPGPDLIERQGGLHPFMGWPGPILTDSGGYQAYSLADTNAVTDDGVVFKSIVDGSLVELTPERAIDTQNRLGADIIMALDDCPPSVDPATVNQARLRLAARRDAGRAGYDHDRRLEIANERTIRWLERCVRAHRRPEAQSLFGIVQGGTDLERRDWCIERVGAIDLPGYAIGGVAVGEGFDQIVRVVEHCAPRLPADRPRYLMGVGYERDLVAAVRAGVDMFDCVLPTRNGRNANAFTPTGTLRLRNAGFAEDPAPIDEACDCVACSPASNGWATPDGRPFGRAYLRHLFMADEMLGPILVTLHNLRHFQRLMLDIRAAIRDDAWSSLARRWPVTTRPQAPEPGPAGEARLADA